MEIHDVVALLLVLLFLVLRIVYGVDIRLLLGLGIGLLVAAGMAVSLGARSAADGLAAVSFYCIVTGVALLIVEHYLRRNDRWRRLLSVPVLGEVARRIEVLKQGRGVESLRPFIPCLLFLALALLTLGPLLAPGYVLTLDMVFTPQMSSSEQFYGLKAPLSGSLPMSLVLDALDAVPMWFIQKLILLGIVFFSALGMFRLLPESARFGRLFGGVLYAVNPFVYVRFLSGQWGVLLGYALLPFALKALFVLLESPPSGSPLSKQLLSCLFFFTLVSIFDLHMLVILLGLSLILLLSRVLLKRRDPRGVKATLAAVAVLSVLFVVVNSYWLVPALAVQGGELESIGVLDLYAFAPEDTTGLGVGFSLASMHGFWRGGYDYAFELVPGLLILYFALLLLAVLGFIHHFRDGRMGWRVIGIGAGAIIAFILALGVSSPITEDSARWAFETVPFVRGFRDSQKFIVVLVLAYSFLGGLGVDRIVSRVEKGKGRSRAWVTGTAVGVVLILPMLYSFPMFWGFGGQLGVVDYPSDWYEVNDYLESNPGDYNVLFLPWHMYMDFGFTGSRLANPAESFFGANILQSQDPEMGLSTAPASSAHAYVTFLIDRGEEISNMGAYLSIMNVRYVLLAKEVDYFAYSFLFDQEDLRLIRSTPHLFLFENIVHAAPVYLVDRVVHISSLDDLLSLENVSAGAFLVAPSAEGGEWNTTYPIYERTSPIDFKFSVSSDFAVFVPPNHDPQGWTMDGVMGQEGIAGVAVYHTPNSTESRVHFAPSTVYFASYFLSAIAAVALALLYLLRFDRRIRSLLRIRK